MGGLGHVLRLTRNHQVVSHQAQANVAVGKGPVDLCRQSAVHVVQTLPGFRVRDDTHQVTQDFLPGGILVVGEPEVEDRGADFLAGQGILFLRNRRKSDDVFVPDLDTQGFFLEDQEPGPAEDEVEGVLGVNGVPMYSLNSLMTLGLGCGVAPTVPAPSDSKGRRKRSSRGS